MAGEVATESDDSAGQFVGFVDEPLGPLEGHTEGLTDISQRRALVAEPACGVGILAHGSVCRYSNSYRCVDILTQDERRWS